MKTILGKLSPQQFLEAYWQKKPCLIRQAIPDYMPPLDGDDLAGLACDDLAESRLVSGQMAARDWQVRYGPFNEKDFSTLPENNWTLLVQDVEKHYPPLQELLARFDFLPSWRLDDLMISYAAPGGSVGPHVDQYDVFLFQAQGQRRWQIAESFNPGLLDDCPLNVLSEFQPEHEWVLMPGDMLYLPPNVAHHGVALDAGMTWSIGLRAPSAADLLMALGEESAQQPDGGPRYADPELKAPERCGEIGQDALQRLQDLLLAGINDRDSFECFTGRFISRYRLAHEPIFPGPEIDQGALVNQIGAGARLVRNPWTRLAWIATDDGAKLFCAGSEIECSPQLAEAVCADPEPDLFSAEPDLRDLDAILHLINGGHFVLTDE